ncbi:Penicillin-binding protein activator LpoB [BD1-7 clade bacterium]|uniref:Penicillin-binding protein activator LpoB n=1 Tax=BD1-7 clade bacterium TaxID=2029982 RepID=A0A5S9MSG2_9GAMM|nr:Penicillin-binding protein activator LpoB [BD1-7 clade bacterium]CAA0084321.1 Penicillin-binding protein activator LpoB [BD1-7 clade bacterium]CAA0115596.1 Penicillin-binding protein activator LpoB [BD1-7 clade bacterium]
MKAIQSFFVVALLTLISACSSVQYGDATEQETVNTDFGSTDLQLIASKMVDDMLAFPPLIAITEKNRPIMFIDGIDNKTTEHIDMDSITDTIQTKLIQSGKYRFVDPSAIERVRKQFNYQQGSGLVDPDTAVQVGRQLGAQYMLYGAMSSITKQSGSTRDVYYKFTLKLMDLKSGILEWSGEKEIRKTKEKRFFGS